MFKRSCENKSTLYVCLFGKRYIFREVGYNHFKYCPNCGAKMELEER